MSDQNRPRIELQSFERIEEVVERSFSEESRTHFRERSGIVDSIDDADVPQGYDDKLLWAASLHRALAWDPTLHNLWYTLEHHALREGTLDQRLKELLAVLVNESQKCSYCVKWHSASAKVDGVSDETIDMVQDFDKRKAELPPEWRVPLEFARKVATDHTRVTDEDVQALRDLGYDDGQIVEIVSAALTALMFGRFNVVLNLGE